MVDLATVDSDPEIGDNTAVRKRLHYPRIDLDGPIVILAERVAVGSS
jgi:hypothetical protein